MLEKMGNQMLINCNGNEPSGSNNQYAWKQGLNPSISLG
jgi:hypothetical protein